MSLARRGWMLLLAALAAMMMGLGAPMRAQSTAPPTTTVQDTLYNASGAPAAGTVLVSWSAFTTAGGSDVPAGSTSATIGSDGVLTLQLVPNAGATPLGSYYTVVLHLSDGTTSRQYWVVPAAVAGAGPAKISAIQNQVLPTSVAMQTVSKQYVDNAIARAVTGTPTDASPYVLKAGDTMTGPLGLPADPASPNQAADKNYVDESVAALASGWTQTLPVFGGSGSSHARGLVPDPGATAGTTRYLREDGSWSVPNGSGGSGSQSNGTLAQQDANAVAITGGSISVGSITATDGTQGLVLQPYTAGGGFGAVYPVGAAPTGINYALASNGAITAVNAGATLNINILNAGQLSLTANAFTSTVPVSVPSLSVGGGANAVYLCSGGTFDKLLATSAAACTGGTGIATSLRIQ